MTHKQPSKGATCSRCGRAIVWLLTVNKKWMPADAGAIPYRANPEGKELLLDDRGRTVRCDTEFEGRPDGYGRRAHWATCPNADEFRRRRGGGP